MEGLTVCAKSYTDTVFDGAGLKRHRDALGLSLDDLAKLAQVNRVTINRIELGKVKKPRPGTLRKLVSALSQTKDRPSAEVSWLRQNPRDPRETAPLARVVAAPRDALLGDIRAAREALTKAMELLDDALRRAGG